jgi:hypothetical protein
MFDSIVAKWTGFSQMTPRHWVAIPLDRPDLMADAGYDGLRYVGSGSRGDSGAGGNREAAWWMPFHAAAG